MNPQVKGGKKIYVEVFELAQSGRKFKFGFFEAEFLDLPTELKSFTFITSFQSPRSIRKDFIWNL